MLSETVGVQEQSGIVQYIVNGLPVYSHANDDLNAFRFITSNLIAQGLCKQIEVVRLFGVSSDSVHRYWKKYCEQGETGFFGDDARHGKAHKITGEKRRKIQAKLDKGMSNYRIAQQEGVGESAIRYQIKKGNLKKKPPQV